MSPGGLDRDERLHSTFTFEQPLSHSLPASLPQSIWNANEDEEEREKEAEEDRDRLEKIFRDKVFDKVLALPQMRKVTLQNDAFVKKAM